MSNESENLETFTVEELRAEADRRGIHIASGALKADIIAQLGGDRSPQHRESAEGDGGAGQVQSAFDQANEKGYFGTVPDPTPNFNYTVDGNDAPTPETDEDLAAEARKASGLRG